MGVRVHLETAQKHLVPLMQQKDQIKLYEGVIAGAKLVDVAVKAYADKKLKAGGGMKKLSACIAEMAKALQANKHTAGLNVIKKFQLATAALETTTIKQD